MSASAEAYARYREAQKELDRAVRAWVVYKDAATLKLAGLESEVDRRKRAVSDAFSLVWSNGDHGDTVGA